MAESEEELKTLSGNVSSGLTMEYLKWQAKLDFVSQVLNGDLTKVIELFS